MKKLLCLLIAVSLILSLAACKQQDQAEDTTESTDPVVASVFTYPDYTLPEGATAEQMRQTAVQAMRDLLSIQWSPAEGISYFNTAGRDKQFDYIPGFIYGGLLYSGAGSGLFQYLEYYNQNTGRLTYPGTSDELRKAIGSGCADSLLWSWSTVANSFACGYYPSVMVYKNGFLPVGNYTYDKELKSYYTLSTEDIIAKNTRDVIVDAYTKVLPADALISSSADHAMMAIELPVVQYKADGTIDTAASYIAIQDQRGGRSSTTFYEEQEGSHTIYYNSQRAMKITFDELLKKNYIPVTIAEFIGEQPYEKAYVSTQDKVCTELKHLQNVMIESNYPLALINVLAVDNKGKTVEVDKILFHGANGEGPPCAFNFSQMESLHTLDVNEYTRLMIEVVVATGERFTPVDIPI